MKDPRLAAALLESSPDALRDTLLVAQAHIARLADPEDPTSLGPELRRP